MKVTVVTRSGRELVKGGLELNDSATVADLQDAIHKKTKKLYPSRQRLTLPIPSGSKERPVVLNRMKSIKDYTDGNTSEFTVVFKDLGPQVSYRTLFFFEYLGPLFIYPIFYYLPVYELLGFKEKRVMYPVQTYAMYYWCFHYFKRIMETFFVHRFSHATSPLSNVFRNCAYYWSFGAYIAYYVNHPLYTPVSDLQMKIGFGFGVLCQLSNFYCHIILKNLRAGDGGGYQIPTGFLFNIVTCANYTTEIYQWLGFNIATQTVAGYVFLIVATSIMTNWALAKHRRLRKLFDGKDGKPKYPRRWSLIAFSEEIGREAKAYQEYMEKLTVPEFNATFDAEYNTWEELSKIMEEFYKQPLHYLTITTLKQWDKQRIGTKEENKPLDDIIHLLQAEPTIWYVESVNRLTASSDYLRELWISDPKYREFARVPNGS